MTYRDLSTFKSQLATGKLDIQPILDEIGEDLLTYSNLDPRYLNELDIFLRELHRAIRQNQKDLYTNELKKTLTDICAKASYAAENASNTKKGERFYREVQNLGHMLIDNAPNFQSLIGLVLIMNPQMKFWN